jgi:murein DD-endopeptidase MepM/ murein hydrolase activator NlpD
VVNSRRDYLSHGKDRMHKIVAELFPSLKYAKWDMIDFNACIKLFRPEYLTAPVNPLLDATNQSTFLDEVHQKLGIYVSYGGYMEYRSDLWRDSYLQENKKFYHLGVDFNVPSGTPVYTPVSGVCIDILHDTDTDIGWGTRVIVKLLSQPLYLVFGHLEKTLNISEGDMVGAGSLIGFVGKAPSNGNVFSHLHVQLVSEKCLSLEVIRNIDGYDVDKKIDVYPNPLGLEI